MVVLYNKCRRNQIYASETKTSDIIWNDKDITSGGKGMLSIVSYNTNLEIQQIAT